MGRTTCLPLIAASGALALLPLPFLAGIDSVSMGLAARWFEVSAGPPPVPPSCAPFEVPLEHREYIRQNSSRLMFTAYLCEESPGEGYVALRLSGGTDSPQFRIRVVGPTVEMLEVRRVGAEWRAPYSACFPGTYHVEVVLWFLNLTCETSMRKRVNRHPCLDLDYAAGDFKPGHTQLHAFTLESRPEPTSGECRRKARAGRWVDVDARDRALAGDTAYVSPAALGLRRTRLGYRLDMLPPNATNLTVLLAVRSNKEAGKSGVLDKEKYETMSANIRRRHGSLRFIRDGAGAADSAGGAADGAPARPAQEPQGAGRRRRPGRKPVVCLLGDSQFRHISSNWPRVMEERIRSGEPAPWLDYGRNYCAIAGLTEEFERIVGECVQWLQKARCDAVVVNFGAWELSHQQRSSQTHLHYQQNVRNVMGRMLQVTEARHLRLFWSSLIIYPACGEITWCPPHGIRFPHMIRRYNDAAREVIDSLVPRVPWIDHFNITDPLYDLSFDCNHYGGPVIDAMLTSILDHVSGAVTDT